MTYKVIGIILVITGCGGFGFYSVYLHRRCEKMIRQLLSALDFMECELQYRMTPLPELCSETAAQNPGWIRLIFSELSKELDNQILPEAQSCMDAVLSRIPDIPRQISVALKELGQTLGRFDLPGQLRGLEGVRQSCKRELEELTRDQQRRLQSYQTLGLCAGAALAILFI